MRLDDNLESTPDGETSCLQCGTVLALAGEPFLARALQRQVPLTSLGPQVREDPQRYSPLPITARLTFCPGCLTQLAVDAGPASPVTARTRTAAGDAPA